MKVGFYGGKFLPVHQGHVFAITTGACEMDKFYVVLCTDEKEEEKLGIEAGTFYATPQKRISWIGQIIADMPNVELIHINEYRFKEGSKLIKKAIPHPITHVYSSERSYGPIFEELYPGARHVLVDEERKAYPISATEIRSDPYSNWDMLPKVVRKDFVKKVCIVGTESCGKSTMVKYLAKLYNTNYVHEVGMDYCEKHSNQLTEQMFDEIAMEHYNLVDKKSEDSNKVLFIDTEAVTTQYYLDMYLRGSSKLIDSIAAIQKYDMYIFLEPTVDWVDNGYRFAGGEDERLKNNGLLKGMFEERDIDYRILPAYGHCNRLMLAKIWVDQLLEKNE
jgi:HTH-type transcriptional repressor of NAD biosynthesis genes